MTNVIQFTPKPTLMDLEPIGALGNGVCLFEGRKTYLELLQEQRDD